MSEKNEIITDPEELGKMERPTPKVADTEQVRRGFESWFATRMPEAADVRIPQLEIPATSGMSNITLMFDLHWQDGAGRQQQKSYAARLQPQGGKLVFPEYDLRVQYLAMERLQGQLPLPVLAGLEEDNSVIGQPFFIMEKLDGVVPPDLPPLHMAGWVAESTTPAQREQLWWTGLEAMVKVHQADWQASGFDFLNHPERGGERPLDQLLHYWNDYLKWAPEGLPHPEYERCIQWFYDNKPASEEVGICWGDARLGNTMYSQDYDKVIAVLDWEMAVLGDRVKDLAWWIFLDQAVSEGIGIKRLEGFPGEEETIEFWKRGTGLDASAYHYYKLHAAYCFGLISTRTSICSGRDDPVGNNFITPIMVKMLDELDG